MVAIADHARRRARRSRPAHRTAPRRRAGCARRSELRRRGRVGHGPAAGRRLRRLPRRLPDRLGQQRRRAVRVHERRAARRTVRACRPRPRTTRARASPTVRTCAGSWWCGTTPASTPTCTRSGGASSATAPSGTPQFLTGDFFIGAPAGGGQRRAGDGRRRTRIASQRFLVAYNQIGPPTADIVAQLVDTRRQPRRRSAGALARQPLAARAERRLQHPQRHLHGGVGRLLQPGWTGRRARAHRAGLDRRARRRCVRSPPAPPSTCRRSSTTTPRGQFFVAWYTQPSVWGRTDGARRLAGRRHVARRLQLRDLRRARPVLQPGRRTPTSPSSTAAAPRTSAPRCRRPARPTSRSTVTATAGDQRQLQPAHHAATSTAASGWSSRRATSVRSPRSACGRPAARRRPRRRRRPPPPPPPPPPPASS